MNLEPWAQIKLWATTFSIWLVDISASYELFEQQTLTFIRELY